MGTAGNRVCLNSQENRTTKTSTDYFKHGRYYTGARETTNRRLAHEFSLLVSLDAHNIGENTASICTTVDLSGYYRAISHPLATGSPLVSRMIVSSDIGGDGR
eukprot:scaffold6817_cov76-Cyclotella_meneghiniana.AAC.2